jgi:hypothetical protein
MSQSPRIVQKESKELDSSLQFLRSTKQVPLMSQSNKFRIDNTRLENNYNLNNTRNIFKISNNLSITGSNLQKISKYRIRMNNYRLNNIEHIKNELKNANESEIKRQINANTSANAATSIQGNFGNSVNSANQNYNSRFSIRRNNNKASFVTANEGNYESDHRTNCTENITTK